MYEYMDGLLTKNGQYAMSSVYHIDDINDKTCLGSGYDAGQNATDHLTTNTSNWNLPVMS